MTCLHGFTQHGDSWAEVTRLAGGGHSWLTPDLTATTGAGAIAEVLELWRREGVERSHLVGYSQGGRLALDLACGHSDRLLTLTAVAAHAGLEGRARERRRAEDLELAARIERDGVEWFARHWAALPLFAGLARRGPEFLDRLHRARLRNDPRQLAATLRGRGGAAGEPFWERLPAISVTTLLVAGAQDQRYVRAAGRLSRRIAGSRVAIVPDAGHAVHLEQPEAFAALLAAHLSSR